MKNKFKNHRYCPHCFLDQKRENISIFVNGHDPDERTDYPLRVYSLSKKKRWEIAHKLLLGQSSQNKRDPRRLKYVSKDMKHGCPSYRKDPTFHYRKYSRRRPNFLVTPSIYRERIDLSEYFPLKKDTSLNLHSNIFFAEERFVYLTRSSHFDPHNIRWVHHYATGFPYYRYDHGRDWPGTHFFVNVGKERTPDCPAGEFYAVIESNTIPNSTRTHCWKQYQKNKCRRRKKKESIPLTHSLVDFQLI
jgi:hypothetical protein